MKVTVTFPHYGRRVQRVLRQDANGLYVSYQGQRVAVRPALNSLGEAIEGHYIGRHPMLEQVLGRRG